MSFEYPFTVRFSDEDHAQMVYYPRVFHYVHVAFEELFASHGRPYNVVLDQDNVGWPAVSATCDFARPMKFGDALRVRLDVTQVGHKSVTLRFAILDGDRTAVAKPRAQGQVTVVAMSMTAKTSIPIPVWYREMFGKHLIVAPPA